MTIPSAGNSESGAPLRVAVLLSGGGTTLQNLIDVIHRGELAAQIVQVVASRAECGGIDRAERAGLPVTVVRRKDFPDVETFSEAVFSPCAVAHADLVVCGGFLALLKVLPEWRGRVINIHPSLIPAFSGAGFHGHHVHEAALARGVKLSGCTVHFVDDDYDHGPIILQSAVPVLSDDTPETLAARVFTAECSALPEAISLIAENRIQVKGNMVQIDRIPPA